MSTVSIRFSAVPVGAFFYMPVLNAWLFKVSRRRAHLGTDCQASIYAPNADTIVNVLA